MGGRPLYPVNLLLTGRLCLVVGGGAVALRKTDSLLAAGARVRLVSPEVVPQLAAMAATERLEWIARVFVEGDLLGAFLVFATTGDRHVQARIAVEADRYGVLLNSADDPLACHFHVPAHFRRGRMLVTVSTGGASPALAKMVRKRLEKELVPGYAAVVELLAMLRAELLADETPAGGQGELFQTLFARNLVELVLAGNWFELQMLLLQELPPGIDAVALIRRFLEKCEGEGRSR